MIQKKHQGKGNIYPRIFLNFYWKRFTGLTCIEIDRNMIWLKLLRLSFTWLTIIVPFWLVFVVIVRNFIFFPWIVVRKSSCLSLRRKIGFLNSACSTRLFCCFVGLISPHFVALNVNPKLAVVIVYSFNIYCYSVVTDFSWNLSYHINIETEILKAINS